MFSEEEGVEPVDNVNYPKLLSNAKGIKKHSKLVSCSYKWKSM